MLYQKGATPKNIKNYEISQLCIKFTDLLECCVNSKVSLNI